MSADIARANGWKAGDILEGAEDGRVSRILLTYIGETTVMAREVSRNGKPVVAREHAWSLSMRDWKHVSPPSGSGGAGQ